MQHRPPALVPLALAGALLVSGCVVADSPTAASDALPRAALLIPGGGTLLSAEALPINRIRAVATRPADGAVLDDAVFDVDPAATEWEIEVAVPPSAGLAIWVTVELIHLAADGSETVEFSGRILVSLGDGEPMVPELTLARGPLANLLVTSIVISSPPGSLTIGATAALAAAVVANGGATPIVYWEGLDASVLTVDDDGVVTAVGAGPGRVVATAGTHSDTATIVVQLPDSDPPVLLSQSPAPGDANVFLGANVVAEFDEDIEPTSVTGSSFTLLDSLGAGVPATLSVSGATVTLAPSTPLDSLHRYTAVLGGSVADLAGNPIGDPVTWSFTTGVGAVLLGSFNANLGTVVSIAFDGASRTLYLHPDFDPTIYEYSTAGVATGDTILRPGVSSNDIDLDMADVATSLAGTPVPANSMLVHNGEVAPGMLYALNIQDGSVIDSIPMPVGGNPVGGAYHPGRGTFFSLAWNTDIITEVDLDTGLEIASFTALPAGAPAFDVFYGDIDVDPVSGDLLIVSSAQNVVRTLRPDGTFVSDVDVSHLGVTGMSGIAWDPQTETAWISSTTGFVFQVGRVH